MSSSSDIEKLFDHFGGDATAYQEIGRENEARSARTRWPLLVTLDLTQPTIPAIGQRREAKPETLAGAPVAVDRQDTTPKDAASVTRAKAPLFTRSHRRDIPPVAVAAAASGPRGASRVGEFELKDEAAPAATVGSARGVAVAPVGAQAAPAGFAAPGLAPAPVAQASSSQASSSQASSSQASSAQASSAQAYSAPGLAPAPAAQDSSLPPVIALRTSVAQTISSPPAWAQAPAPPRAFTAAPQAPAAPSHPASILGKLFAPESEPASPPRAAASAAAAPLQGIFDRLRGTPAQTAAPTGGASAAAPRTPNSWLVNGPRRS